MFLPINKYSRNGYDDIAFVQIGNQKHKAQINSTYTRCNQDVEERFEFCWFCKQDFKKIYTFVHLVGIPLSDVC